MVSLVVMSWSVLAGSLMVRPLVGGCIDGDGDGNWWLVIEDGDFCLVLVILIALHHLMMTEVDGLVIEDW